MLVLAVIPAIVLGIGIYFVPESPRWLVMKGRQAAAKASLSVLRAPQEVPRELDHLEQTIAASAKHKKVRVTALKVKWIRRLVLIGIGLGVIQQIAGINVMMYYGTSILQMTGFGRNSALITNIANGVTAVAATLVTLQLLKHVPRRPLLIIGLIGTSIAITGVTFASRLPAGSSWRAFTTITMMMIFLAFFQGAISPMTWLLLSEIFPEQLRGLGMGTATFSCGSLILRSAFFSRSAWQALVCFGLLFVSLAPISFLCCLSFCVCRRQQENLWRHFIGMKKFV